MQTVSIARVVIHLLKRRLPVQYLCRRSAAAALFLLLMVSAGCSGSGKLSFISLNQNAIDPPPVEPWAFDADRCFVWVDEDERLNLVMRSLQQHPLLGAYGRIEVFLAMRLGTPPAGLGRDYSIRPTDATLVIHTAVGPQRFTTYAGIISVLTDEGGGMHGSFRVWLSPVQEVSLLSFLQQRSGPVLCYGSFRAVRDRERGPALRRRMLSPIIATQPTSSPTTESSPSSRLSGWLEEEPRPSGRAVFQRPASSMFSVDFALPGMIPVNPDYPSICKTRIRRAARPPSAGKNPLRSIPAGGGRAT